MLESARPFIEDAAVSLRGYKDKYEFEPETLTEVEDRLELIKRLEKKYGDAVDNIIQYRNGAENELRRTLNLRMKGSIPWRPSLRRKRRGSLDAAAAAVPEKGKKPLRKWKSLSEKELKELAFGNAEFIIRYQEGSHLPARH